MGAPPHLVWLHNTGPIDVSDGNKAIIKSKIEVSKLVHGTLDIPSIDIVFIT